MSPPHKEGIESTIEFVKYIVALSGGGIAFAIQPSFYEVSVMNRVIASFSILCLTISIVAAIFAHSRGSLMLSRGEYDPDDKYLRWPGLIMLGTFTIGFIFLICGVGALIWRDF